MKKHTLKTPRKAKHRHGNFSHSAAKQEEKKVKITVFDYDEKQYQEAEAKTIEECFPYRDEPTVTWINIDGIHQLDIIEKIGLHYNMHPLILEDITTEQRPKIEDFGDYIFVILKMLYHDEKEQEIKAEQVSLILGSNFVISFQETEGDIFNPIRDKIRTGKGRIRKMKADYLAYILIDTIIDEYFLILEKLGEDTESIEDEVVEGPTVKTLHRLHNLKREILFLRKSVWPLREVINNIQRSESNLVHKSTGIYLRDAYDHTIQIIDSIETFRDLLAGILDIYLSTISNRMNEIMKVLTIIATIFIPLTFITGVFGMNFRSMFGLDQEWGYPVTLFAMFFLAVLMIAYFRRKKWL